VVRTTPGAPLSGSEQIISGTKVKQVAPDRFLHPVHAMRRWLEDNGNTITGADFSLGRVKTVDSTTPGNPEVPPPVPAYDPTLVQPPQGAGRTFFSGHLGTHTH
jgi:hypothetical protein